MKNKSKRQNAGLSRRIHFPGDEERLPWLPLLLDAHAIADTGVAIAIRDEEKKRKTRLACGKGCGACCAHQKDLPLYPHELVGIYWYASKKIDPAAREVLKTRLLEHAPGSACPFLIDDSCSIHPLRPIGCRQFNVFATPCGPGEDPYYTRRHDVLVPLSDYTDRAFARVLPLYQLPAQGDIERSIRLVRTQIMNLQSFDWKKLAELLSGARNSAS